MVEEKRGAGQVLSSFHNPFGQLQGGMYAVFLDAATAMSGRSLTVSLHVSLLQPAKGSWVTVTGQVIRRGSRIIFAEGEVRDEDGTVLARATQTGVPREAAPQVPVPT